MSWPVALLALVSETPQPGLMEASDLRFCPDCRLLSSISSIDRRSGFSLWDSRVPCRRRWTIDR